MNEYMLFDMDADWIWSNAAADDSYGAFDIYNTSSAALFDIPAVGIGFPTVNQGAGHTYIKPSALNTGEDSSSAEEEGRSEVTQQVSNRKGALVPSQNGSWRFYGATSNLHLMKRRANLGTSHSKALQQHSRGRSRLEALGLARMIDTDLINHLLRLYFTWHNPSLHIVDREMFNRAYTAYVRNEECGACFSEFLLNAMYENVALLDSAAHADH